MQPCSPGQVEVELARRRRIDEFENTCNITVTGNGNMEESYEGEE
jgi:hypothetical protein